MFYNLIKLNYNTLTDGTLRIKVKAEAICCCPFTFTSKNGDREYDSFSLNVLQFSPKNNKNWRK